MKIGILTYDETGVFQQQVIGGIHALMGARGDSLVIHSTRAQNADLTGIAADWNSLGGVMVIANALSDDAIRTLYEQRLPISLVSHLVRNSPIPAVIPDNVGGMIMLVDYLVRARGRKRIAFIQGNQNQTDGVERTRTFQQELLRHNIDPDERLMLRGEFDRRTAANSMRALLDSGVMFDSVAAADYVMALSALEVLNERKIAVPEEVCVVGFGDGPEAAEAGLTTVGVDVEQIGVRAAKQLIGQLEGLRIEGVTLLATEIVERATC